MTKEDLIAALKKKPITVTVGDVEVFVKPLTVAEKEKFAAWRKDNPGPIGVVGRLLAASLCDESGALLFAGPEEVADLDGALAEQVWDRVIEISGMGADPKKASSPSGQA
ncbi:hypothetical protein VT84_03335 [Gemmata sp. SH-PL17]|uniref:hypothetical protein n=1 Tax=Gemmata sp. SH-PL17 TaxID=1630693 RepID=UPI00078C088A|nr:hypothetical protein [Gemmata sp. SH-PL17]AMV23416.1 hypothetical protein VT84_03335 [Gemmata sp. SH-PL17]